MKKKCQSSIARGMIKTMEPLKKWCQNAVFTVVNPTTESATIAF